MDARTLAELADLELDAKQLAGVLRIFAKIEEQNELRKAKDRKRKARSRDKDVTVTGPSQEKDGTKTGQSRDVPPSSSPLAPPKEKSPVPPKEITPLNPPAEQPNARARRLPPDFEMPDQWLSWALGRGHSREATLREFVKMRNWSQYAKNGACRDWFRRFQNWMAEAPKENPNDARTRNNGKPQFSGVVANLRDMLLQPENGDRGGSEPLSDHEPEPGGRRFGVA